MGTNLLLQLEPRSKESPCTIGNAKAYTYNIGARRWVQLLLIPVDVYLRSQSVSPKSVTTHTTLYNRCGTFVNATTLENLTGMTAAELNHIEPCECTAVANEKALCVHQPESVDAHYPNPNPQIQSNIAT